MSSRPAPFLRPGWAVWLTGLPASGKSTIAQHVQQMLRAEQVVAVVLDSDALRSVLAPDAGYDEAGRVAFYSRLVSLADLLVGQGVNILIAATANRRAYRDDAYTRLPRFAEVWVKCPVEVCRSRDVKGLYARAQEGTISHLPGVDAAYEAPDRPALTLDTSRQTAGAAAAALVEALPNLFT